ncbi:hypothetical protein IT407_00255 [Candidatus Uhrbacteria bacterium]|nr:hypothetical protein [Candidatus Uhrbacteria bacterium]
MQIIPALLVQDRETLIERMRLAEGLAECVHIDCMDGIFVPNKTWHNAEALETSLEIELHLMVNDPLSVIREWRRVPQTVRALWHVEVDTDHRQLIEVCRALGWECGLAISPDTSVDTLSPFTELIDEVLVMGVKPGFSGQTVIPATFEKIREIKKRWPALRAGFDGGATKDLIPTLREYDCDRLVMASAIYSANDPRETLHGILNSI